MSVSERRVCCAFGQHRSAQRKTPRGAVDEAALTEDIIAVARQYGRKGDRRVTALGGTVVGSDPEIRGH